MNIQTLRAETYKEYEILCLSTGAYCGAPYGWSICTDERNRLPFTNKVFKDAIRQQFGDLRRKSTWKAAAIHYAALGQSKGGLEPYQLVCYLALPEQITSPVREAYGPEVIEALLSYPETVARIRRGLEQLVEERPDIAKEFMDTYAFALQAT